MVGIYGREMVVVCDFKPNRVVETYSGFSVRRLDNDDEVARFYEGDPREDFDTAMAYAHSISNRVYQSSLVSSFWTKTGFKPKGVRYA